MLCLLLLHLGTLAYPRQARAETTIDIGVLSLRTLEESRQQWQATARWLESQVPGRRFRIVPLNFDALGQAVAEQRISFLLTTPQHYVLLHASDGVSAIATLMPLAEDHPVNHFGGVIFTLAGRDDIRTLADLKGKKISAVSSQSLGGYLAQYWTLFRHGLDPQQDLTITFSGMPYDNVIREVLAGRADAGFVRTGVLEHNIAASLLDPSAIRVLHAQPETFFPLKLSTALYPEWPFAKVTGVAPELEKAVTLALLNMPSGSEAATSGGYFGFSPPANYADVEAMMRRLDLLPDPREFGWRDVLERYAVAIVIILTLLVLAAVVTANTLRRSNRALNRALKVTDELAHQRAMLLSSLGEGVYGIDRSGRCTFINRTALTLLGYEMEEVIGEDQHLLFHHHKPDGQPYPLNECPIYLTLEDGVRREVMETFFRKSGEPFPVRMTATPLLEGGVSVGAVVAFQDISEESRRLQRMRLLDEALKAAHNGIVITAPDGTIEWVNPAMSQLTGYSLDEVVGQNLRLFKSGVHDKAFYANLWQTITSGSVWHGDIVNRRKDGSTYDEEMTITPVLGEGGVIEHFIAVKQNVSERKRLEEELRQLATTDALTGIANRRHFLEEAEEELQRIRRYGHVAALLMLDLDHFKRINDTWGHAAGDEVLRHFTRVVESHLRATDLFGRLGGEEFAILLPESELDGAMEVAEGLCRHLGDEPTILNGETIACTASIGVTLLPPEDQSPGEALSRADEALYRAKEEGRNTVRALLK